jgi:hypothetical protein
LGEDGFRIRGRVGYKGVATFKGTIPPDYKAWKWYNLKGVRTCYSRYLKNLTLPVIFNGTLNS